MAFDDFLRKAGDAISDIKDKFDGDDEKPSQHTENTGGNNGGGGGGPGLEPTNTNHRFKSSFAPSSGDVKWYVDGASYFHAVSMALEGKLGRKKKKKSFLSKTIPLAMF